MSVALFVAASRSAHRSRITGRPARLQRRAVTHQERSRRRKAQRRHGPWLHHESRAAGATNTSNVSPSGDSATRTSRSLMRTDCLCRSISSSARRSAYCPGCAHRGAQCSATDRPCQRRRGGPADISALCVTRTRRGVRGRKECQRRHAGEARSGAAPPAAPAIGRTRRW